MTDNSQAPLVERIKAEINTEIDLSVNLLLAQRVQNNHDLLREALGEIERLRPAGKTVEELQNCLRDKNRELDSLYYVWCDGGCKSGVHRFGDRTPPDADIVARAIRNTCRLVSWFVNNAGKGQCATMEQYEKRWQEARALVTAAGDAALREENRRLREAAGRAVDTWRASWDCSRSPGHPDVSDAVTALAAELGPEEGG